MSTVRVGEVEERDRRANNVSKGMRTARNRERERGGDREGLCDSVQLTDSINTVVVTVLPLRGASNLSLHRRLSR